MSHTLLDKKVAPLISWDIQGFIDFLEKLQFPYMDWQSQSQAWSLVGITSSQRDLDEKLGLHKKNCYL